MDVTAHPEDAPLRKRFKVSAVAAVVTIAVSVVVWAYTSFATIHVVDEIKANARDMRASQQTFRMQIVGLQKDSEWTVKALDKIAEAQGVKVPPLPVKAAISAEEQTP